MYVGFLYIEIGSPKATVGETEAAMEHLAVHQTELECQVAGSGEPVLFIPPSLVAGAFQPLLTQPALADRHRLIRYHRRGMAGSTHTDAPVTIPDQAADAAALLAQLGVERAHIVGHSYGGLIGLQLALDAPRSSVRSRSWSQI